MMAFGSPLYGRSSSVHGSNANTEGLQMRLSDDVRPTPEVSLPASFQIVESSLLNGNQYSFDVEESFLDWMKDIEDREKQQEEWAQEQEKLRIKQLEKNNIRQPDKKDKSDATTANSNAGSTPAPQTSPRGAQLGMDILMPTPSDRKKAPTLVMSGSGNNLIDLADFENASDPFEAAELQTINDMEELKSVLSSSAPSANGIPPSEAPPMEVGSPPSGPPISELRSHNTQVVTASTNVTELGGNAYIPEVESINQSTGQGVKVMTNTGTVAFRTNQFDVKDAENSAPGKRDLSQGSSQVDHDDLSQSLDNFILHTTERPVKKLTPLPPIRTKASPATAETSSLPSEGGARRRSQSSPMELGDHVEPPGYPQNLSKYAPLPPSRTSTKAEMEPEDPAFSELDEEGRNFAQMITSMGFPKGRTARAIGRLGHDDKMVIDALCAIDRLCNKGYDEERVEEALNLLDNDDEKILKFLKLMQQFQELGFKPEDIKRELLLHGNEEEKVLDALTAKP